MAIIKYTYDTLIPYMWLGFLPGLTLIDLISRKFDEQRHFCRKKIMFILRIQYFTYQKVLLWPNSTGRGFFRRQKEDLTNFHAIVTVFHFLGTAISPWH